MSTRGETDSSRIRSQDNGWRRIRIVGIIVALFLTVVSLLGFVFREPRANGQPLSFWLKQIESARTLEHAEAAAEPIRAMGSDSFPFLLRNLRYSEFQARRYFWLIARRQNLFSIARPPSVHPLYQSSLFAIHRLGPAASPIIPELSQMLTSSVARERIAAFHALAFLGDTALQTTRNACDSHDQRTRAAAAELLAIRELGGMRWEFGLGKPLCETPAKHLIIEAVTKQLKHENLPVRRASADWFLCNAHWARSRNSLNQNQFKRTIPILIEASRHEDPRLSETAKRALNAVTTDFASADGVQ